jgi:hypothetical protein
MHADGHQDVGVLPFQRTQLVEDVQAIDATERPKINQDDLAAQLTQAEIAPTRVEPRPTGQLGRAKASQARDP